MAALAEAFVRIRPDTSTFKQDLEKGVDKGASGLKKTGDKHGKVFGTAFVKSTAGPLRGIAGVIGPPVAAAFAVIGGAKLFAGFIAEAREAQKTGAQTAAVIKSTGGVAKVSAVQVGALATAISNKVGVDDEAIQSGANMLLTFTNIRNEAGKGNKVFDQATATVTDMAAAMNNGEVTTTGLKTASIQVGKALNDPIKGITALSKVGVTFTEGQKKQIAALVKSGNVLGAQKVILGELNKEFGGSAAAGTNAMDKLKVVFGNIQEQIGTALLPVIDKLASWLATRLPGALATVTRWFNLAKTGVQALIGAFKDGDVTSDGFVGVMERIGVQARVVFEYFKTSVLPRIKEFGSFLKEDAIPALISFGQWIVKNQAWLVPLAAGILAIVAAVKTWIVVTKAFAIAQAALNVILALNPLGIVILALIGIAAALVVAYKRSETFRNIVNGAFNAVKGVVMGVFNWIKDHWKLLLGILTGPIGAAVVLIVHHWDRIKSTAAGLWNGLKAIWTDGVNGLKSKFLDLVGHIIDGAVRAFGWVPKLGDKLRGAQAEFRKFRDGVNAAMNGIRSKEITVTAKASVLMGQGLSRADAIATSLHRATGGPVFGAGSATSDSIPAMLSNGEHVLTAREVRGMGGHSAVAQMRKVAAAQAPGFAGGGPVDFRVLSRTLGLEQFRSDISAVNRFATDLVTGAAKRANATGGFSANLAGVVRFAQSQAGKPYGWGSSGPSSFDCSGFVSNLVEVAKGMPLYRRLFATGSMGSYPWTNHFGGAFKVGWTTNAGGGIGHTAATVNGVNMESRGGDGVVVGSRSRGANQGIFNRHAFLARGGPVLPGDPPFDLLDPRGKYYKPGWLQALANVRSFDTGGWLPPRSATMAVNGTNQWEPVGTAGMDYDRLAGAMVRALDRSSLPERTGREVHRNIAKGARA